MIMICNHQQIFSRDVFRQSMNLDNQITPYIMDLGGLVQYSRTNQTKCRVHGTCVAHFITTKKISCMAHSHHILANIDILAKARSIDINLILNE